MKGKNFMGKVFPFIVNGIYLAIIIAALIADVYTTIDIGLDFSIDCNVSLTLLTIVFTVWFSCLLAIKQIYQKSHEKNTIIQFISRGRNLIISNFIILFLVGITISVLGNSYVITNIVYCGLCFIYLIICASNIFKKVESSELSISISSKVKDVINQIDANDLKIIKTNLNEINQIYDDCFYKSDVASCKEIIRAYTEFLTTHLLKINEKILCGGIENAEKFSVCLKESIKKLFKNENSDLAISTNRQIILATKYVAADAIACNAIDILKMILIIYEDFTTDKGPSDPVYYNDLYDSLAFVLIRAIKSNKQEIVDIILDSITHIRFSLEFTKGFNNTQLLSNLYVSILYAILLKGTDVTWKYYRRIHNDLAGLIIHANKIQEVEYPCLMLQAFVRREDFCKNSKAQELYYELLQNLIRTRNTYANILYCV